MPSPTCALIVVDVQKDFLPGGSLAVPDGDAVIPAVLKLLSHAELAFDGGVYATQDWHPADHSSFGAVWPVHCVQGSIGAAFADQVAGALERADAVVVRKGTQVGHDSYSGFRDNEGGGDTGLERLLLECGVERVYICGLATDYCVKFSALDALKAGFETFIVNDACVRLAERRRADAQGGRMHGTKHMNQILTGRLLARIVSLRISVFAEGAVQVKCGSSVRRAAGCRRAPHHGRPGSVARNRALTAARGVMICIERGDNLCYGRNMSVQDCV
jgi:nicotinamidase/pyrazinamidase